MRNGAYNIKGARLLSLKSISDFENVLPSWPVNVAEFSENLHSLPAQKRTSLHSTAQGSLLLTPQSTQALSAKLHTLLCVWLVFACKQSA